mgnify:CR=1 FL=1
MLRTRTTTAFVWVDGHMICQDNHAYNVALGSGDNPLPIQGQDSGDKQHQDNSQQVTNLFSAQAVPSRAPVAPMPLCKSYQ